MPPIHETDIAAERWSKGEWDHYELWEKIELRLRRRKYLWIAGAVILFLIFSAIPIVIDRSPKWMALKASRHLAQVINEMKRDAGLTEQALQIRFKDGSLNYVIEKVSSCAQPTNPVLLSEGSLLKGSFASSFRMMNAQDSRDLKIPGLIEHFCYDPLLGSEYSSDPNALYGFGIAPTLDLTVKPMTEARLDRISILFLQGQSAEISFE